MYGAPIRAMHTASNSSKSGAFIISLALLLGLFGIASFATHHAWANTAAIRTDQSDYAPESVVHINGTGFVANSTVTLTLTNPDNSTATWNAQTNSNGDFATSYQIDSMAGSYSLVATDGTNTATTSFTDSVQVATTTTLNAVASPVAAGTTGVAWSGTVSGSVAVPNGSTVQLLEAPGGCTGTFAVVATTTTSGGSFSDTFTTPSFGIYGIDAKFPTTVNLPHVWTTSTSSCQTVIVLPLTYSVFVTTSGLPNTVDFDITTTILPQLCSPGCTGQPGGTTVTLTYLFAQTPTISTTSTVSGAPGVQYASTTAPVSVTSANSGHTYTFNYQTQYLVTYAHSGCDLAVSDPSPEWVNSGGSATGIFPAQVNNVAGDTRCNYVSDDRPSNITSPTTVTAAYQEQFLVTYADTGCVLHVTDPSSEWVNSGASATGVFPAVVDNGAGTKCVFVSDNRPGAITAPSTITATYQTQYFLTVNATPSWIPSSFLVSGAGGWYNSGATVSLKAATGPFTGPDGYAYYFNGWTVDSTAQTGNPITVTMNAPHTATANYVTPQYLTFGWSGPASLSKGQVGTFTASYTIAANVALTNVKVQGGITVKATSIVVSCDGQVVWTGSSWPSNSGGVTLSACGGTNNLKINTSNNNNVLTLTFGSMAAGSSHTLSIQYNWSSSSSGTYNITGAWSASCSSIFGTLTTPYTRAGSVTVN